MHIVYVVFIPPKNRRVVRSDCAVGGRLPKIYWRTPARRQRG